MTGAPRAMAVFLVECFVPAGLDAGEAVARFTGLAGGVDAGQQRVHLLLSVLVPDDETWFGWFEAPDAASLADLARRAAFPVDRISRAVVLAGGLSGLSAPVEDVP